MNLPLLIQKNVPLKNYTTWKVGGPAQYLALPEDLSGFKECIEWALNEGLEITFLGQGSNVLISDEGINGLVLCSKKFQKIEIIKTESDFELLCQSGVLKFKAMRQFLKAKLEPALFLSGIPGDLGGGVVMNAGVSEKIYPREFCEITKSFKVLSWAFDKNKKLKFTTKEFLNKEIDWSYRSSKNWQPGFIYEVKLSWPNQPKQNVPEEVKKAISLRQLKQPWDKPSCGSVFVNPEGYSSGALIEKAELKGFKIGGAQVAYKHANFILNTGEASAMDLHQVIEHVKSKIFEKNKIKLHTEVVYLGPWKHLE